MDDTPFTMRQMIEAGMHFGHTTRRCNPKMLPWIFGQRNGVHIIDLEQSAQLLRQALKAMRQVVAQGGKILIVGTKSQAQNIVAEAAKVCGQYYINRRWLGGTLTNWQTVSKSIDSLKTLDEQLQKDDALEGLTKKEKLRMTRRRDKIERALGGIRDMNTLPDLMFVIDTNKESTAVKEAHNLEIPISAVLDSNSNPDGIAYPIPGNDDAVRALTFYLHLLSQAVISGRETARAAQGQKPEQEAALAKNAPKDAPKDSKPTQGAKTAKDTSAKDTRKAKKGEETKDSDTQHEKKKVAVVKKKAKRTKSAQNNEEDKKTVSKDTEDTEDSGKKEEREEKDG